MVKIEAERLADLNTPRTGHATLCVGGEMVVAGGHTTGFVPTATAEYYADGQWHTLQMAYPHDDGIYVAMESGQVLLAGGHERNLGIGQTFETELYDAATHSFGSYGCQDTKRSLACGTELDSGRVVISGNWYGNDGICLFDGKQDFTYVKPVSVGRASPFVLRTAPDDVLIFGSQGTCGQILGDSAAIVDRLRGESFTVPLLRQWKPITFTNPPHYDNAGFIGDASQGIYAYLLLASDSLAYDHSPQQQSRYQSVILMVRDTVFSLLPTASPIPRETRVGGLINWYGPVIADRHAQRAYVPGIDKDKRLYLLSVEYAKQPAPLTLYYTDPLPDCGFNTPVLTADGDLAIIGGNFQDGFVSSNYEPVASAWLIRLNGGGNAATGAIRWPWVLTALLIVAVIAAVVYYRRRPEDLPKRDTRKSELPHSLFPRILNLMNNQQLFRNPNLKPADVAADLATNPRYVTDSIRAERNQTFSQFVNDLRLAYAQQLLRQHSDKKVMEIAAEAGFSSERSFFRIFKAATGMTTQEWMQKNASVSPISP